MKREATVFVVAVLMAVLAGWGCSSQTCVVATSQTGVGIVASYNAQSQMPEGKLGYLRNEVVVVPTNKTPDCAYDKDASKAEQGGSGGAKDAPNVIMDFSFGNWFCFWESQNLSNRIAVGDKAVKVAPFLFMQQMKPEQLKEMGALAPMIKDMAVLSEKEDAADNKADSLNALSKRPKIAAPPAGAAVDTDRK